MRAIGVSNKDVFAPFVCDFALGGVEKQRQTANQFTSV
jgi:hypothetical protein